MAFAGRVTTNFTTKGRALGAHSALKARRPSSGCPCFLCKVFHHIVQEFLKTLSKFRIRILQDEAQLVTSVLYLGFRIWSLSFFFLRHFLSSEPAGLIRHVQNETAHGRVGLKVLTRKARPLH
jgi:hypothetical protein